MKRIDLYLIVVSDANGKDSHAVFRTLDVDYNAEHTVPRDWVTSDGHLERVVSHRGARLPLSKLIESFRTSVEHDPSLAWVNPLLANGDKRLVQGDHPFR